MKILVTGADGFIGSHLAEALVRHGRQVRAFVQYNTANSWGWLDTSGSDVKGSFEVIAGDIRDPYQVREAVRGCEAVCHLAALISIPYSYEAPSSYVETNVSGTLNVLEAARSMEVLRVIVTSTSEVYGTAQFVPISELHPLRAQSPYAASKIAADQLALAYHSSFQTPVVVLRPFNTYGPRQSTRAVIPTIITQLASGISPIKLGSVTPTRDFSYVLDTVSGFIAALDAGGIEGEVINLGSNFEISIQETYEIIAEAMQRSAVVLADDARVRPETSEVQRLWSDNSKAKRLMGWTPSFAGRDGFKRGIRQTIEWFTDPQNLARYKGSAYNI